MARASLTPPRRNPPPIRPYLPPMEQIQQDPPPTEPIHPSSSATTNTNYNGASEPLSWQTLEDANAHLQNFLEICNTISIQGVP